MGEEEKKFIEKYFGEKGNYIKDKGFNKLRFSNLVLDDKSGDIIGNRYGIRINRKTRTTEHNSLFRYEYIVPGIKFKGDIEFPDNIAKEDLKFILACLYHLDTIGGFKSRGIGKVEVVVEGRELEDENTLDEIINKLFTSIEEKVIKNIGEKLQKYRYKLELKEPFILTGKEIGSYVKVRDSIQGSTIRGAMIEYFSRESIELEKLLKIESSDAIIIDQEIELASKFITKYKIEKDGKVYKYPVDRVISSETEIEDERTKKKVKLERAGTTLLKAKGNEISIKINSKTKSVEDGMLFNSEYLECNDVLVGDILLPEGLVEKGKEYSIYLGKMKSKGFGKATIKFEDFEYKNSNLKERIKRLQNQTKENILTFDLQSDLVLPFNDIYNVGEQFKALVGIEDIEFQKSKSYITTGKLGGYNIINNIRKIDELVITRGSVLTYRVSDINKLLPRFEEIERVGLGLRRKEGFGRVKISSERGEK